MLALMLLNHARRLARLDSQGRIVTLDRQDRDLWNTRAAGLRETDRLREVFGE